MNDLRQPTPDETPLSRDEVVIGLREGTIPLGPLARRVVCADVLVVEGHGNRPGVRQRVEVFDIVEGAQ